MTDNCYLETLEGMVSELREHGGDIQSVVVLARVVDDESEGIFIGMSEDVMDDPSRVLGHLELDVNVGRELVGRTKVEVGPQLILDLGQQANVGAPVNVTLG